MKTNTIVKTLRLPNSLTAFRTVETWYDRHSRNYITQTKDVEGNQLGDALYAGCRANSESNHVHAVDLAAAALLTHINSPS